MGTYLTYTTNPNEHIRLEGTYVNRKKPDSQVVGVNLNTVGLLGQCVRGPLTPQLVSSPTEAAAIYGGRDGGGGGAILGQVWLATKKRQFSWPMVIRRVAAAAAAKASVTLASGGTTAVAATGSITSAAKADYTDGQILTISDGTHTATVFEIDKTGNGVGGSNVAVDLSTATTANECAIILAAAINGVTTTLTVTAGTPSSGTFTLTADTSDATHNVTITTNISATGFAVSGMSGGVTYVAPASVIQIEASSVGTWANGATGYGVTAAVTAAADADSDHFNLSVTYAGKTYTYQNLDVSATGVDNLVTVIGGELSNPVVVTKLANGRPTNISAQNLSGGADGSIATGDFSTAFLDVAHMAGVSIVAVCEEAYQPYAAIVLCGADGAPGTAEPVKTFCTCAASYNATASAEVSAMEAGITTTARNIVWCYNPSSTLDDSTTTLVEGGSHLDMAAILSQTDADINPGDGDTVPLLSGVSSVRNTTLTRGDLITLKAGGVAALEQIQGGFQFHSGIATDGSEIADVRTEQALTASIAQALKYDVKKKMTASRRRNIPAKVIDYLRRMQRAERYVAPDDSEAGPAINVAWVDTFAERAANMVKLLTQVRTMAHFNYIVLETDMGTGVTVRKQ